nr:Chain E, GLY-GLY-LYS-SER-PHE-SER-LYS-PRO-ARG [Homo sapiens]
GGKSFSKPR